ncbi:MAG: hypothetical protein ACOX52_18145 [Verrucomicrobiota bacterium]
MDPTQLHRQIENATASSAGGSPDEKGGGPVGKAATLLDGRLCSEPREYWEGKGMGFDVC